MKLRLVFKISLVLLFLVLVTWGYRRLTDPLIFPITNIAVKGDYPNVKEQQLKDIILTKLNQLKTCKNEQEIQQLIQNDTTFDYTMIMFERYLMAEKMNKESSPDLMEFITDQDIIPMKERVLTWKEELDQNETAFLARALDITIHTIQRDVNAPEQIIKPKNSVGDAHILYIPGHYQILVPKTVVPEKLMQYGYSSNGKYVGENGTYDMRGNLEELN